MEGEEREEKGGQCHTGDGVQGHCLVDMLEMRDLDAH